jgi:pilus assembly protein CpaF
VHAVIAPVAADGTCLTIRRFGTLEVGLSEFAPPAVVQLLIASVATRLNIVVSGATSSGKTTLLNALAAHCPPGERIITIEDAAELRLRGDHVVRLESRSATADGAGSVSIRDLVHAALRMRPDRLVIGEVRGHEAFDAVQAMNTGHDGSLTTVHANSTVDALRRLEAMMLAAEPGLPLVAVREQVHGSIDLVIQVGRGDDGRRRIVQIAEVAPEPRDQRVRVLSDGVRVVASPTRHRIGKEDRC